MKKLRISTRQLGLAALAGCLVAGSGGTAKAALLWNDPVAIPPYVAGSVLNGQSGGTGTFFTGAWAVAGTNDHHVAATSLPAFGQPLAAGGALIHPQSGGSIVGTDTSAGGNDTARDARLFSSPWDGFTNPDGTFYISFLANFGVGPTMHHRVVEMWDGDQNNDGNRNLQLGYSEFTGVGSGASPNTQMGISIHDSNDATNHNADLIGGPTFGADGKTHLIVLRFDLSNSINDRVRAYLDPIGTLEPASAAADISVGEFLADRMGAVTDFVFGNNSGHPSAMDEIRVGDTFADVANLTVPEPASFVLLGLGAIGFGVMARRKQA
jgi:hypothetical protein